MSFILVLRGGGLPALGLLQAFDEHGLMPGIIAATGDGALAAGLYAATRNALVASRLTIMLARNRLALLRQTLPALTQYGRTLAPDAIWQSVTGVHSRVANTAACFPPEPAAPDDALSTLLCELTGNAALASVTLPLAFPLACYNSNSAFKFGAENTAVMTSGPDSRWAIPLGIALRCAAFPADVFRCPVIGGRALAACPGESSAAALADIVAARDARRTLPVLSLGIAPDEAPEGWLNVRLPDSLRAMTPAQQIRTGCTAAQRIISESRWLLQG